MPRPPKNALATLGGMKADYGAMVETRFRRQRVGVSSVGGSGDSHYYNETRFIRMREYVRAMVRDDSAFKFLVNRSVANEHGIGFQYEPDTGDKGINRLLKAAMDEWASDRRRCDSAGRRTLAEMGGIVAFSDKVDGDVFAVGQDDGAVRLVEADELRSPTWAKNKRIVHGIELDPSRRHVKYYFVKDPVQPQPTSLKLDQFAPIAAYDAEGFEQVWQVCDSHRIRQTRGITIAHPIFDKATMYEDIDFALLVKQQFAALIAWFLKRDENYSSDMQLGSRSTESQRAAAPGSARRAGEEQQRRPRRAGDPRPAAEGHRVHGAERHVAIRRWAGVAIRSQVVRMLSSRTRWA